MGNDCIAFIFARGGSKGVERKNIKDINGKPLIAYSIECAKQCESIDRIIVSTDSQDIADIASSYGAEVPFIRPEHLATDESPEWLSWQHAVQFLFDLEEEFSTFVSVPCTSPLRSAGDIDGAIALLDNNTDVVLTCTESKRNPYFNMLKCNEKSYFEIALKPDNVIHRRQDTPVFYDIATVAYVTTPEYILKNDSLLGSKRIRAYIVAEENSLDIDTEYDFKVAELLIKDRYAKR